MKVAVAGLCGLVFGAGLSISGMTNPAKVLSFLDIAGSWDPTLALVMAGALFVSALGYVAIGRMEHPWLGGDFAIPTRRDFDLALIGGAALFGIGWGLVGLCPGPALAGLGRGSADLALFVIAMLVGVLGFRLVRRD